MNEGGSIFILSARDFNLGGRDFCKFSVSGGILLFPLTTREKLGGYSDFENIKCGVDVAVKQVTVESSSIWLSILACWFKAKPIQFVGLCARPTLI